MTDGTKITKQPLDNVTLNGQPVHVFIEEEAQREADKLHKDEVRKASSGTGYTSPTSKYGNTSGQRSQKRNLISAFSPEVLSHLNYLNEIGGTKAVNEHLAMPKQSVEQLGPIEAALRDAEEKTKYYQAQADKAQQESTKFSAVAEQLRAALSIMQGKPVGLPHRAHVPRTPRTMEDGSAYVKLPRGFWNTALETLLANGRQIPRQQLLEEMRALAPNSPPDLASAALTRAIAIHMVQLMPDKTVKL